MLSTHKCIKYIRNTSKNNYVLCFIGAQMSRFTTKFLHTNAVKRFTQLYTPKTSTQQLYSEYLNKNTNSIIVATGPAGTGKTLFACTTAIEQLKKQNIDKIILTRPVVPVEEDIGFLPGNIESKMDPWVRPIMDIFTYLLVDKIQSL